MGNGLTQTQTDVLQGNGGETIFNKVAYSVHRNGVAFNVLNNTPTKIPFTTKEFDQDSSFDIANSRFSPKPGKYMLMGAAGANPTVDQGLIVCLIYKNGVQYKSGVFSTVSGTGAAGSFAACMVIADPGDYFELWVDQVNPTATTLAFPSAATDVWFQGFQIG